MAPRGRLTRERMGYSAPATSSLYGKPPLVAHNIESISITFETDPDAILDILPEPFELWEPATAMLVMYHIGHGALGTYNEASIFLRATYDGRPYRYNPMIILGNDMAFAFGREVLGLPKKIGNVTFERRHEGIFACAERPAGHRLVDAVMYLEEPVDLGDNAGKWITMGGSPMGPTCALRMTPEPSGIEPDVRLEILESRSEYRINEAWSGRATITYPKHSNFDDWIALPVEKLLSADFTIGDISMPVPKLLHLM